MPSPVKTHVTFNVRESVCPMLHVYPEDMAEAGFASGASVVVVGEGDYNRAVEALEAFRCAPCEFVLPAFGSCESYRSGEEFKRLDRQCRACRARSALSALSLPAAASAEAEAAP